MKQTIIYALSIIMILLSTMVGCNFQHTSNDSIIVNDLDSIKNRGVLNVITLSSSTSYFLYKGEERGYEYEIIKRFADDIGVKLNIIVADNITNLSQMLLDSVGDIIVYNMPITGDSKSQLLYCGPERISHQVVIQSDKNPITDVTELVGKDVYVERGSKYEERINNLNNELGGGINIHCINRDTIVTEDLIEMVSNGEIEYTLADEPLARLNRTYYNNIDIYLSVSFPQRSRWAVRHDSPQLAQAVDQWITDNQDSDEFKAIARRYFESSKRRTTSSILSVSEGRISEHDAIFKREAAKIGWDWRMLAAIAFHESRFDSTVVSWVGAQGIMQLMPATAQSYGLSLDSITMNEPNVRTAAKLLKTLERSMTRRVSDPDERIKFILAAYNAGLGHVYDAIALAKKYNKNPEVWHNEVEEAMLMKINPEYYNDEVCKCGYFRGGQTKAYVYDVINTYNYYCEKIPK